MAVGELIDVDLGRVEDVVGPRSFRRGLDYTAENRVLNVRWDEVDRTLVGRVVGQGAVYQTEAYFDAGGAGRLDFVGGACSCPVGDDCKHVAAVVAAAIVAPPERRPVTPRSVGSARRSSSPPASAPSEPPWLRTLQALADGGRNADVRSSHGASLAIELRLEAGTGSGAAGKLLARLLRRGRNRWVYGDLTWSTLDPWRARSGDDPDQLRVLRQLYGLHLSSSDHLYPGSYRPDAKIIDLAMLDGALWPLLDEAVRLGVRLIRRDATLGEVRLDRHADLHLDVTRPEGQTGLVLQPRLVVDGAGPGSEAVPVAFLGTGGHGVVYVDRGVALEGTPPARLPWELARLARPAPPALQELALSPRPVEIPADGEDRFAEQLWPRLRRVAPVVSSDGSFAPPVIEGPRLVLRASYGAGHVADVVWEWWYRVGDRERRATIDGDHHDGGHVDGYRDLDAERGIAAALDRPGLAELGLMGSDGLVSPVRLTGLATARLATEVLPLLADDPDVLVEVVGEPADFREVSDSLVIGISTDDAPGETDWFDLGVVITADDREVPFVEVFQALAAGEAHLLLPDGAFFSLLKPELQALRTLIDEARSLDDQPSGELRISRYQLDLWDELSSLGIIRHQAEAWERQVAALHSIQAPDGEVVDPPATLTADLRSYQRDGFAWLRFLWEHRLGGILADDMGLGKTVQALALMCHAREREPDLAPFLVVAPTSVAPNWVAEARRFAPQLAVTSITDTLRRSGRSLDQAIAGAHVAVTTYTLLRLDAEAYRSTAWAGMVLDEAQHAKNHRSKTYAAIRQLPAPFKLAVTGTPMENSLMELWSLLSITAPGLFPSPTRFAERYARPVERQRDGERLAQLRRRIRPLMKRRTKELVAADLPPKQEQVLDVELHPQHRRLYQTHLQRERQKILGLLGDFDRNRFTILRSITLLRQLSLHPVLVDEAQAKVPCAKLDALADHIGEVDRGGHRALVFSQFTGFLRQVRQRLDREGIGYCYLDGRTRDRAAAVNRFKDGSAPVFLISLKAGGVGLNLTEADYCFLLDPWWNPATESQAIDRTHRIGQTRNVMVYRLIARDTIEEKVMALRQRKAELFQGVMDDGDLFSQALDADDVRALFA